MATITVRLSKEESELFNSYAETQGLPLSTVLKESLKEKLEDEFDIAIIKEHERKRGSKESLYTHNEAKTMLSGIE